MEETEKSLVKEARVAKRDTVLTIRAMATEATAVVTKTTTTAVANDGFYASELANPAGEGAEQRRRILPGQCTNYSSSR